MRTFSTYNFHPYGMQMPNDNNINGDYRYGYNGMELDNEVCGAGNSYTTEFRQYDPRLGRWKSLDPLMQMFPSMSPYCAFDNNPIYYTDIYGLSSNGPGGPPENPCVGDSYNDGKNDYVFMEDETGKQFWIKQVFVADVIVVGHKTARCINIFVNNVTAVIQQAIGGELSLSNTFLSIANIDRSTVVDAIADEFKGFMECVSPVIPPIVLPQKSQFETLHTTLDFLGMIPIIGEIFDFANALIYAAEGDFSNALVSASAIIPVIGSTGTAARQTNKLATELIEEAEERVLEDVGQNILTRREAMQKAIDHAQVPRNSKGGEDILMEDLNGTSRGVNWSKQKSNGGIRIGRRNKNGKNYWREDPDGHPKNKELKHHRQVHFHAVDRNGRKIIIPYK